MNDRIGLLNFEGDVLQLVRDGQMFTVIDQWKKPVAKLTIEGVLKYCSGDISIYDTAGTEWSFLKESENARVKLSKLTEFLFRYHPSKDKSFTWDLFLKDIEEYPSKDWPDDVYYGYITCLRLLKQKATNYHPPKFRKKL